MKKTFNQTIERACTGVFFWAVFVIYALFKGLQIDHLETLVIAEITAIVAPYFIRYVANSFK